MGTEQKPSSCIHYNINNRRCRKEYKEVRGYPECLEKCINYQTPSNIKEQLRFWVGLFCVFTSSLFIIICLLNNSFNQGGEQHTLYFRVIWCFVCTILGFGSITLRWWEEPNPKSILNYIFAYLPNIIIISFFALFLAGKYFMDADKYGSQYYLSIFIMCFFGGYNIDSFHTFLDKLKSFIK